MIAIVDLNRCVGCGRCEIACPTEAIWVEGKAVVDESKCRSCGSCTVVCEIQAIVLGEK